MSQAAAVAQAGGAGPLRVGAALAGVVLAAVLLFSLGVMTGTRIAAHHPDTPAGAPALVPPPPAPVVAAVKPPASPAPASGGAGTLTFYDRLSGAAPPLPAVQADEKPEPAAPEAREAQATAPPARQPAAAKTPAPPPPPAGDAGARVRGLMGSGPYAVQVAAVTDRQAAAAAAARLKEQGIPAATVAATAKGKTWYRLRVGSFPNREAAVRAAALLQAELGLDATPVRD